MYEKFNSNKFKYDSNYKTEAGFTRVRFGHDMPLLETELNEMQVIQEKNRTSFVRHLMPSGFIELVKKEFIGQDVIFNPIDKGINKLNHIAIAPARVVLNGYELTMQGNFSANGNDGYILIDLGEAPESDTREDLVYLEAWFETLSSENSIQEWGYQEGNKLNYKLVDNRINEETSRRIALCWNIRVAKNVNFKKFNEGFGYDNITEYSPIKAIANGRVNDILSGLNLIFANASHDMFKDCEFYKDNNLWIAGRPDYNIPSSIIHGNYIFALPLFKIKRRNKNKYSLENFNGSLPYNDSNNNHIIDSYIKGDLNNNIRPDRLYYDFIDKDDLIDMRRTVSINNLKNEYYLNKSLKELFNGSLKTKDTNQMRRIQFGNIKPTYNSNNVIFSNKFDKSLTPFIPGISNPEYNTIGANPIYECSLGGFGLHLDGKFAVKYNIYFTDMNHGTIDFFMQPYWHGNDENISQQILSIEDANGNPIFVLKKKEYKLIFDQYYDATSANSTNSIMVDLSNNLLLAKNIYHIRLSWSNLSHINSSFIYINGKLAGQGSYITSNLIPNKLKIGNIENIQDDNGVVIEDLIIYNRAFEQSIINETERYIKNEYWPNLPKDFINHDTLLFPSFNGIFRTFSDNPCIQEDTVTVGKIVSNMLNLETPQNTIIDSKVTPKIYDLKGNELIGYWSGLDSPNAKFTLTEGVIEDESNQEPHDIISIDRDLSKLTNHIEYNYNDNLKNLIQQSIEILDKNEIINGEFAIIVTDVNNPKLKIIDINNDNILYDDILNSNNVCIPGIKLKLNNVYLSDSIFSNDMILLKTTKGDLIKESSFELLGNIPHIHYSEELKQKLETIISIINEKDIINNEYLITIEDVDNSIIKIIEKNTEKELYNEQIDLNIQVIPGLNIDFDTLYENCNVYNSVIIKTKKGDIKSGKFELSSEVNSNYNYDVNLKDLIASSIQLIDENEIIDNEYEIVITNISNPSFKIIDSSTNETIYENLLCSDVTVIPGLSFNFDQLPTNAYINDAVKIKTYSTTGTISGSYSFESNIEFVDYYSDRLRLSLESNITVVDYTKVKDGIYNIIITDVNIPQFKVVNIKSNEILYNGNLGSNLDCIPGIIFNLPELPQHTLVNDTVQIKTSAQDFNDISFTILNKIPFIHYSEKLSNTIYSTLRLKDINEVLDDSFKLTIIDIDPIKINIIQLSTGKEIYNNYVSNDLDIIPGITLSLDGLPEEVVINSTVIINTMKIEHGLDVIVQYNLVIPSGNGGYDLPTELLSAGKFVGNKIEEISFNVKNNIYPREVKYIKPRVINNISDKAYDFSSSRTDKDCFARLLLYHVNGNGTAKYNISCNLYGYEVIGITEILNKKMKSCKLIKNAEDASKNYFEVELNKAILPGELIQFQLALGGMVFDYETHSKTLISDICKTKILEFTSTGEKSYIIPCVDKNIGGGVLKSTLTYTDNIFNEFGQITNKIQKRVAYIDNNLFIPEKTQNDDGTLINNPNMILSSYEILPGSINSPFLKIEFDKAPQVGSKINIPVLISYQPADNEIISLWYKHTPYQGILSNKYKKLKKISDWKFFITTLSSGNLVLNITDKSKGSLNNIVNRLPGGLSYAYTIDSKPIKLKYTSDMFNKVDINNQLLFVNDIYNASENNNLDDSFFLLDTDFEICKNATGFQDGKLIIKDKKFKLYFPDCIDPINKYLGMASLVVDNKGEMFLFIIGCLNNKVTSTTNELIPVYGDLFKLSGLPITNLKY